jgi:hypothetical protein
LTDTILFLITSFLPWDDVSCVVIVAVVAGVVCDDDSDQPDVDADVDVDVEPAETVNLLLCLRPPNSDFPTKSI